MLSSTQRQMAAVSPRIAGLAALTFGALVLGATGALIVMAAPAAAYDDDVDVVCYDINGGSEVECATIAELTAECALADPEYTTEPCAGLLEDRVPVGLDLNTKKRDRGTSVDNEDKSGGRDSDGGRDGGSGNGGGSGGGSSGGSSGGGSGPNG